MAVGALAEAARRDAWEAFEGFERLEAFEAADVAGVVVGALDMADMVDALDMADASVGAPGVVGAPGALGRGPSASVTARSTVVASVSDPAAAKPRGGGPCCATRRPSSVCAEDAEGPDGGGSNTCGGCPARGGFACWAGEPGWMFDC
jgi:hypothetical protein